uniref:CSON002832 protein n=1 Tax=Culicoides sonorensis TaxID=179676 RepID=A0A336MPN7_CULSO
MKKSSSLESFQTMIQETQMSDEPRGPVSLKTPQSPGRAEQLRAVFELPSQESITNDQDPRNQSLPSVNGYQRSSPAVITTQPKERNGPPQYVSLPPAPVSTLRLLYLR